MDNNGKPYEIIASPYTVYRAILGTAFPAIDTVLPAAAWVLIGKSGDKSQFEAGVKIKHDQTLKKIFAAGATGPVKAFRDQEDLELSFEIMDMSLEAYANALNDNPVAVTAAAAGVAGSKQVALRQGLVVSEMALLIRGASPYGNNMLAQYEVPRAFQSGKPSPVFAKGKPAGLSLAFTVLEDLNANSDEARFGYLRAQTAIAL